MQVGHPLACETRASLADGLTVPTVGVHAFATGAPLIDKVYIINPQSRIEFSNKPYILQAKLSRY